MKVIDVIDRAPEVRTIRFLRPEHFDYKPGQFVLVSMTIDGEHKKRAYSIASSPTEPAYIDITFKRVPNGKVSPALFETVIGTEMDVKGPFGLFTLDEQQMSNLVLIGGGTGITPLRSITKYVEDKKLPAHISVIYGARTPLDLVYEAELQAMHANHPGIDIYFTVNDDPDNAWKWHRGNISIDFIKECVHDLNAIFYLCGPPAMVEHLLHDLTTIGVSPQRIHMDRW